MPAHNARVWRGILSAKLVWIFHEDDVRRLADKPSLPADIAFRIGNAEYLPARVAAAEFRLHPKKLYKWRSFCPPLGRALSVRKEFLITAHGQRREIVLFHRRDLEDATTIAARSRESSDKDWLTASEIERKCKVNRANLRWAKKMGRIDCTRTESRTRAGRRMLRTTYNVVQVEGFFCHRPVPHR